ncbi:MAG: transglutaminase-like domain-containing protein [Verrucomicrobiota bacterium]
MMTQGQQQALLALLRDADPTTVDLLKQELVDAGESRLEEYEDLLPGCGEVASRHLQEVIDRVRRSRWLSIISCQLAEMESWRQLEEFCWTLARSEHSGLQFGPYARQLDQWASEVDSRLPEGAHAPAQVAALVAVLANRKRFAGNQADYYHPRNCFLPWVIEFRQGIPLTLSLIYYLVGRRAGIPVTGISAPGHFLVRVDEVVFDPFFDGRQIDADEWAAIRDGMSEDKRSLLDEACPPRQMAHRLLLNLRNAYLKRKDQERTRRIDHYLAVLQR